MRKIAAILLIGMLLFNWYGYQLLSAYWQQCADHRLEAALDKEDYEKSALISIKIPVRNLSYYNNSLDYERVEGRLTIGTVSYKYVKRRILKDSLELLCIPNVVSIRLRAAADEFFRQVNDLTQQQDHGHFPGSNGLHHKDFQKDYVPEIFLYALHAHLKYAGRTPTDCKTPVLPACYIPTAKKPPNSTFNIG